MWICFCIFIAPISYNKYYNFAVTIHTPLDSINSMLLTEQSSEANYAKNIIVYSRQASK